jgi:transcriptional regulator with XRE-family HTH domain
MLISEDVVIKETSRFASNLKKARKEAGLTQSDLVKITGLTQGFISDVENNKTSISIRNVVILAKAVKISVRELFI